MIPGPVTVEPEILSQMSLPVVAHYGDEWVKIHRETISHLKQVFQTKGDVFIIVGSGSAGLDAAIGSLSGNHNRILVLTNGYFGDRLIAIARSYTNTVLTLRTEWNRAIPADEVRNFLKKEKKVKTIAMVHHETSSGILNPIREIADTAREYGALFVVDAISSLGGETLKMDEWGIDICVSASQKCLESPPGLALIAVNGTVWRIIEKEQKSSHSWYLSLRTWKDYAQKWADWHPHPVTMATNNVLALRAALTRILTEGLDQRIARHQRIAQVVRTGLESLGFSLVSEKKYLSHVMTAALTISDVAPKDLIDFLSTKYDIQIAAGIEDFKDRLFRIGHMGPGASLHSVIPVIFGIEDYLRGKGFKIPHGISLTAV